MEDMSKLFNALDGVLNSADLTDVTAESGGFQELPDGYYLAEVEKAEIKESKSTHLPMASFQFKIVDDGVSVNEDGEYSPVKGSKNRKIFVNYVLKDDSSVKRFATDMLKFEGEIEGESLLEKECFTNSELLVDALEVLVGSRIYIHCSTSENSDGSTSNWKNLISWKRAKALELPQ